MDYKQQSNQGCLVVDLMYLCGIGPTKQKEKAILSDGLFRLRENYTLGCLLAFLERYPDKAITLYVDNKYFFGVLKKWVAHPRITMQHRKNDNELLSSLTVPFIVYVDNNITDGWTHLPHFMLVTSSSPKFYNVFDPWQGKTIKISKDKLLGGIESLRSHVKVCPFVITTA
ncbi:MAG TPA: hypothetical protein VFO38_00970 [Candidatus Saccharimonadales bacterium]|nr:hypothetical protein [Candidatus Saccharimonadales bacterium]